METERQKKLLSAKQDFVFKELMKSELVRTHLIADILDMPLEEIKGSKLLNTFLWQQYRSHKLGILDVLVELRNGVKIDFEIQVRPVKYWRRRSVFYICKLFTDDLRRGERFERANRVITVSLLDFKLLEDERYHHIYRLRDGEGGEYTDLLEIHIIELRKKLSGDGRVEDWIRLLNAETEEELKMIRTQNAGILEAIKELRVMSFGKSLRAWYESRLKYERDRIGELEYAWDQGLEQGKAQGICQGVEQGEQKRQNELSALYRKLKEQDRLDDFERAMEDAEFRERLLRE